MLRKMLEDVEPGWEGHVLAGNCEYAEGEGDPDKVNAANRLYALWERQGTESREDLSCDTEHAESEEEEQEEEDNEIARRSIVERLFKNVSWDTIDVDSRANLYYYALDSGLMPQRRRWRSPIRPRPIRPRPIRVSTTSGQSPCLGSVRRNASASHVRGTVKLVAGRGHISTYRSLSIADAAWVLANCVIRRFRQPVESVAANGVCSFRLLQTSPPLRM